MAKAVDGRDDVRVPVTVNDSGGDVRVPDQEGRGDDDGGATQCPCSGANWCKC